MNISQRMEALLEALDMNATQFAKEIGYDRPEKIYNVLNGKFNPNFETLTHILNRFEHLNGDWLLRGTGEMFKHSIQEPDAPAVPEKEMPTMPAAASLAADEKIAFLEAKVADKEKIISLLEKQVALLERMAAKE